MEVSYLDRMWRFRGSRELRREFRMIARNSRKKALKLINDGGVSFPVVYILGPELSRLNLRDGLNSRNAAALRLCGEVSRGFENAAGTSGEPEPTVDLLRWIFETGHGWDGPNDSPGDYEAVLDYTAERLVNNFGRKEYLTPITDVIFRRNRRGAYIHDLVWTLTRSIDADTQTRVSDYLLSADEKDVELAILLLHLPERPNNDGEKNRLRGEYLSWFRENKPFLYLTGEQLNQTCEPEALRCDLEAKYLHREMSQGGAPKEALSDEETWSLAAFRMAGETERELLAQHSYRLHKSDIHQWQEWMQGSLAEQVSSAAAETEAV